MKIFVATPMYGGNAKSVYVVSLQSLHVELTNRGHQMVTMALTNESLITRARNILVYDFLQSDCDALLFIDSDHSFNAANVVDMIESGKDLIGAVYPMKAINWDSVRAAAIAGKEDLAQYSGIFAMTFLENTADFRLDQPLEVKDVGTGMMFIRRSVFEKMAPHCDSYISNSVGSPSYGKEITEFFTTSINEDKHLLSEDYHFCAVWRRIGGRVWAAPWVNITHAGDYNFSGSLAANLIFQQEQFIKNNPSQAVG